MRVLITGAAGNLGGILARHLLETSNHFLNLMMHRSPIAEDLGKSDRTQIYRCDLAEPKTLSEACANSDVIVHFGGVLFAPGPERFLPITNTVYTQNLVDEAIRNGVKKFILISFPHVEGPTSNENPCTDRQDRAPISVHAKTRLEAEVYLFEKCRKTGMRPISLRPGMVYGKDILMVSFARRLAEKRLLAVWRKPLPIHLISIDDFNACCKAAIENANAKGIYPLGDDGPTTLQAFTVQYGEPITSAAIGYSILRPLMEDLAQEAFFVIGLNTRNHVTVISQVAMGCVDGVTFNPADVAKVLLLSNATGAIFSHNHPSGQVSPSPEDRALTQRLREIMQLLGIRMVDHLIVGENRFFSFQEAGL